jgi:type VI secretion system secreted protein Hcp
MGKSDMYLKVEGAAQGPTKGESRDTNHTDEIEVIGWSWGLDGNATAFGSAAARTTMQELIVRKRVDSASTGLMSALRSNEVIKKATLSVHKAGGAASIAYLTITVEKARILSHRLRNETDGAPEQVEEFRIAFFKVKVEYRAQDLASAAKGVNTFENEVQAG